MNIHDKINMKAEPYLYLEVNQWLQCLKLDKRCLIPYYKERLLRQLKQVQEAQRFKNIYGCYRVEYENRR
jgi:hypothetical protein